MAKTIDFDAYRQEKNEEPLIIIAFGNEYELPPSPKMSVMESIIGMKNEKGTGGTIPEEEMIWILDKLLGEDERKELFDQGMTVEELEWLILQMWEQYMGQDDDEGEDDQKNSTSQKNGD
ncbi:MAG: hypothetical protein ACLFN4_06680 [Candidatus Acetothermia bacterium]